MTPSDKLQILCDAFRQENSAELRLFLHDIVKSTTYLIEHVHPILKKIPGLDPATVANTEKHSKLVNFELNNLRIYLKSLETLRDTPKEIVLIDDDLSQKTFYQERCLQKGIKFSFYDSCGSFMKACTDHEKTALILIDWYLGSKTTGNQVAMEIKKHGFHEIFVISSVEIDVSPYKDCIRGYFPKNPSWI